MRQRVHELRSQGATPKAIAKTLGIAQADIRPIIQRLAAERVATEPASEAVLCLVNAGWSSGLILKDDRWSDVEAGASVEGLVGILVVRRDRRKRLSVCGFLVDVFCLGVKDALGPKRLEEEDVREFTENYFSSFNVDPIPMPVERASELIHGAIDFARRLGFEPHRDFAAASAHLLDASGECAIEFGCQGKPFFIEGPRDNASRIMSTLERTAGSGNYEFVASLAM